MAILKKGSRRIVVNGQAFRWRVNERSIKLEGILSSQLTLVVELVETNGSKLIVNSSQPFTEDWFKHRHVWQTVGPISILPSQVATLIQKAIETGWEPKKQGETFILNPTLQTSV